MMSSTDESLEDILYGDHRGNDGLEEGGCHGDGDGTQNGGHAPSWQEPIKCAACGGRVSERFYLLAAGRAWHDECLRCCECQQALETRPSLYWREGNIYCQQDYRRLFVIGQCARCRQPIPSSAMVMRSGDLTFHLHCFCCQECDIILLPGDLYFLHGRNLYCQLHYHGNGDTTHNTANSAVSGIEGEESASSQESRLDDGGDMTGGGGRVRRRNKRIRTCFRSEQLRALESYFAQKHNPDGKDWTCLAHKTGLPKRVLQVWFQNARAKMRRSVSMADSPLATGVVTEATSPSSLSCYPTSTIDQSQLSLLTCQLDVPPDHSGGPDDSSLRDYNSQGAPGWSSPLASFEGGNAPMGREGECDVTHSVTRTTTFTRSPW